MANLTTRTVRVFEVPRSLLSDFLKRPEAGQVGVYYLFGAGDDETPRCYIGQSGNVGIRLQQHTSTKDFWTKAMVAVSLTNEWTSTHVAYLEWLSVSRATAAGRYVLLNGNQASNPFTPEPLEADCQEFIETVAVLLATLGTPILEPVKLVSAQTSDQVGAGEAEKLYFKETGCEATGYQTPEGLLVLAGSRGRPRLVPSAPPSLATQRSALVADGIIAIDQQELVFLKDHLFGSPSAAGCMLIGRTTNGRTGWRNARGQSINDLEQIALASSTGEVPT
ncbi:GIY-YIG nuclease family protein [Mycobacterium paragordonae]|uniref:GIY-YIG nuclease family protein n=1 Tax=Mycobacterium paragordonae TaxID=1389713 RepID=A0AAJ1W0L6_9MYCO|nr:GIY-YIG nuclease family protein [Mycobacterium paragordonae]MDP7735110.1 GIY-YIG nuclease family protein [Mycobacterium paragordonae]